MTKRSTSKNLNQSDISILIERLVQDIERLDKPLQLSAAGHRKQARYFDDIEQMLGLFDVSHEYDYSPHLQLFQEAVHDVGLERSPVGLVSYDEDTDRYRNTSETLSVLVQRIWRLTRESKYRRKKDDLGYLARKQEHDIQTYMDGILGLHARTLIVRVNLYYQAVAQDRLRVEHVFRDMQRLIRSRERNPIFAHETGYIFGVEQGGRNRGYHIHAAFFFNGAEVQRDVTKATQIGRLWEQVTRGRGYFNSCNHDKVRYGDRLGIGMIYRRDRDIRIHVYEAMNYLVKDDQHLRLRPKGGRALRRGLLVKPEEGVVGVPIQCDGELV